MGTTAMCDRCSVLGERFTFATITLNGGTYMLCAECIGGLGQWWLEGVKKSNGREVKGDGEEAAEGGQAEADEAEGEAAVRVLGESDLEGEEGSE